jgi:hypothetical protein
MTLPNLRIILGPGHMGDGRLKHGKARHLCIIKIEARLVEGSALQPTRGGVIWYDVVFNTVGECSNGQNHEVHVGRRAVSNPLARDLGTEAIRCLVVTETILIRDSVHN